jgi:hypothetical protein
MKAAMSRRRIARSGEKRPRYVMFFVCTIALFLLLLWGLGIATVNTIASAMGVVIVVAVAMLLVHVIKGDRGRLRR